MAQLRLTLDPSQLVAGGAQAENALEAVAREAVQTEAALIRAGTRGGAAIADVGPVANRSFGMAGGGARMLTMQLSQVVQQASATGNVMQALAIQAPDVGMAFGAIGTAVGILAAVALPALMTAFGATGDKAEETAERIDAMRSAVDDFTDAASNAAMPVEDLIDRYGRLGIAARGALEAMADVQRIEAIRAVDEAIQSVTDSLILTTDILSDPGYSELGIGLGEVTTTLYSLADTFGLAADQAGTLTNAIMGLRSADGLHDQALAAENVRSVLLDIYGTVDAMPGPLQDAYAAMATITEEAARAGAAAESLDAVSLSGLRGEASALAGILDGVIARFSAAWSAAQDGRRRMIAAYTEAQGLMAMTPEFAPTPDFTGPSPRNRPMDLGVPDIPTGGGGGGGGAVPTDWAEEFNSLLASLDPLVRAQQDLAEGQEVVNSALNAGAITAEAAANAMGLLDERYQEASEAAREHIGLLEDMQNAGGDFFDRLIDNVGDWRRIALDAIKDVVQAFSRNRLMQTVQGADDGDSLGTLIFKGLFGGMFDRGGTLLPGQVGIVGENGPERVMATSTGAVITSRAATGGMRLSSDVQELTLTDSGQIMARVRVMVGQAQSGAVDTVRQSLSGWNQQLQVDGAL